MSGSSYQLHTNFCFWYLVSSYLTKKIQFESLIIIQNENCDLNNIFDCRRLFQVHSEHIKPLHKRAMTLLLIILKKN